MIDLFGVLNEIVHNPDVAGPGPQLITPMTGRCEPRGPAVRPRRRNQA